MPAAAGSWRRRERRWRASWSPANHAQLHLARTAGIAARGHQLVAPAAIVELGIKKDRLAIEVGDERALDLTAVDQAQDGDHRLRRLEPADVDVQSLGGPPGPGESGSVGARTAHGAGACSAASFATRRRASAAAARRR